MTEGMYTIVGAGAIGGTLAVRLHAAGKQVQIVDSDPEHVAAIRASGLTIEAPTGLLTADVPAYMPDDHSSQFDRVLLAVKALVTDEAMAWITPRLTDNGYVASMQNGLNEASIAEFIGPQRTVIAFVDLFADVLRPGLIHDGGSGAMALGEYAGGTSDRVRELADDLSHWGQPIVTDNVAGFLWSKLGFGAMLTATALADADMSELINRHRVAMNELAAEVFEVAEAEHIDLEPFDAFDPSAYRRGVGTAKNKIATDKLVEWLATQSKTRSGIWRDIAIRKRRTEVPAEHASLIQRAAAHSIKIPLVQTLTSMIRELEEGEITMSEQHLYRLDTQAESMPCAN